MHIRVGTIGQAQCGEVGGVHKEHVAALVHSAVFVVERIGGGIELVVGAQNSGTGFSAQNSRGTVSGSASQDTALAPFPQNSAVSRCGGSGQAQLGQSKPSFWFMRSSVLAAHTGPMSFSANGIEANRLGTPTALLFGELTTGSVSFGSSFNGLLAKTARAPWWWHRRRTAPHLIQGWSCLLVGPAAV